MIKMLRITSPNVSKFDKQVAELLVMAADKFGSLDGMKLFLGQKLEPHVTIEGKKIQGLPFEFVPGNSLVICEPK